MEENSLQDIVKAISDSQSLGILRTIAKGSVESEALKQSQGLPTRQFYSRMRRLLKTGLVQKSKGFFTLTPLGSVVYEAQKVLQNGISNYWKLKAIDSIEETRDFGEQKKLKIIKVILDDHTIQNIPIEQG